MLRAPFKLEYSYKRSPGTVIKNFFSFLAEKKISGSVFSNGDIFVPAIEFHPETREAAKEVVDLSEAITLEQWTWVSKPKSYHPLQKPFAFALVRVGKSRSTMLHLISDCSEEDLSKDVQLKPCWDTQANEGIQLLAYFKINE